MVLCTIDDPDRYALERENLRHTGSYTAGPVAKKCSKPRWVDWAFLVKSPMHPTTLRLESTDSQPFHLLVQRSTVNTQRHSGLGSILLMGRQSRFNAFAFILLQSTRQLHRRMACWPLNSRGQVHGGNQRAAGHRNRPPHGMLQFTNISRPGVRHQHFHGRWVKSVNASSETVGIAFTHVVRQQREVVHTS